jgi:hypothetical protein
MHSRRAVLLVPLLLAGCAADTASALLERVRVIGADGSLGEPLADKDLTPFQRLLRDRLPAEATPPDAIFALEVDMPEGDGTEGEYLALVRTGSNLVLRCHEQVNHRPRMDRDFHRRLTPSEAAEFNAFLKAHPLADLPRVHVGGASEPSASQPGATGDDPPIVFRFTDARQGDTQSVVIRSPGPKDRPVIDLLHMLARFRDAAPFAGRYRQSLPLTARSLYADPRRQVVFVWHEGDELRIVVTPSRQNGDQGPGEPAERWLAYKDGQWQSSTPPAEFAPAPATEPATAAAPATQPDPPVPATFPDITPEVVRRLMPPEQLPQVEAWWTQPNHNATTVLHYVPLPPGAGVTLGFVVPVFEFDDDHFAVDAARGTLYLIHEGQLFALPIPQSVLKPQENR